LAKSAVPASTPVSALVTRLCSVCTLDVVDCMDAQQLAVLTWSLVKGVAMRDPDCGPVLNTVTDVFVSRNYAEFSPQALSLVAWSLSYPSANHRVAAAAWLSALSHGIMHSIGQFRPAQLSMTALAYGRMHASCDPFGPFPEDVWTMLDVILDAVSRQSLACLDEFTPTQLSVLLFGFGGPVSWRGGKDNALRKAVLDRLDASDTPLTADAAELVSVCRKTMKTS
jgi:hypothetical protein